MYLMDIHTFIIHTFEIGDKFAEFEPNIGNWVGGEFQQRNEEIVFKELPRKNVENESTNVHEQRPKVTAATQAKICENGMRSGWKTYGLSDGD